VLEGVDGRVSDGPLVQQRQVPEIQIGRPERQRDQGVREHPQPFDRPECEQRPEERPREPGEQAERREVADQDVLQHVEAEELLLADRRDRRGEGEHEEQDPGGEQEHAPHRQRRAAAPQRSRPQRIGRRRDSDRRELQRIDRPAR
jgi:hypothetical protein